MLWAGGKSSFAIIPLSSRRQAKSTECSGMGQEIFFSAINISQERRRWHHRCCKSGSYPVRTHPDTSQNLSTGFLLGKCRWMGVRREWGACWQMEAVTPQQSCPVFLACRHLSPFGLFATLHLARVELLWLCLNYYWFRYCCVSGDPPNSLWTTEFYMASTQTH